MGLCMLGLFLIALLIWAAHRETKPLRRFTAAADRLGLDMNAPPLEEVGSRELRTAAGAFNRMQARLQRFVADRTQMLAAISHDLRTPLTRLRLRAEFIDDEKQQSKAIADIDEMQAMISQALTFARDDAQTEARETLDIAQLLRTLCSNLRDSGHRATFHGEQSVPFVCQPIALRRALSNLAENAVRYGEQADVTLSADAQSVTITVEDIGPGIPTSEHEAVFSPFYRLEQSRNRETGGVGLGLSLARGIIRRHGGDIALHPRTPGPGLRVEVSLPMS
ncbi:MAG: HAMP domain-containing protein [Gammaproteobacteria bacterium]|nr:HAMP domain-containing protein [Gammaproteobacteria bacterium]